MALTTEVVPDHVDWAGTREVHGLEIHFCKLNFLDLFFLQH